MQLTQALHKARRETPNRTAIISGDRRTSYGDLGCRVELFAGALRDLGVQPGDRVGILALNSDRYVEILHACWWSGALPAPINCRWSVDEIAFSVLDCDMRTLIADDSFIAMTSKLRERAPSLTTIIYAGDGSPPDRALSYEALLSSAKPIPDERCRGDDPAALFYTGGTTGRSKGVLLSHAGLNTTILSSLIVSNREPGVICLHPLPLFHVAGLAMMLQAICIQSTQLLLPAFDPVTFLKLLESERVVEAALVPTMLKRIIDHPDVNQRDLSHLKRLYYGGSPIPAALIEETEVKLPDVAMMQFYGMTETSGLTTLLPGWCHKSEGRARGRHLATGLAMPCVEIRISGPNGEDLPIGQTGEVWLRGPGVMLGYWNLPEQTAQALQDGWMRTGDGGYLDGDGFLYIVDRLKDMIVTGGENVYSAEVENAILSLPGVAQCAVIGVPDPDWGERVHAVLALQPGADVDAQTVIDHCKRLIANYKCPRSIEFLEELPISGAGKLMKYKLREAYWQRNSRNVA